MEISKILGAGKNTVSVVKDPFIKECVESIRFNYSKVLFSEEWDCRAVVEFKNGNTRGEQVFRAKDFDICMAQVREFLISLKNG